MRTTASSYSLSTQPETDIHRHNRWGTDGFIPPQEAGAPRSLKLMERERDRGKENKRGGGFLYNRQKSRVRMKRDVDSSTKGETGSGERMIEGDEG